VLFAATSGCAAHRIWNISIHDGKRSFEKSKAPPPLQVLGPSDIKNLDAHRLFFIPEIVNSSKITQL